MPIARRGRLPAPPGPSARARRTRCADQPRGDDRARPRRTARRAAAVAALGLLALTGRAASAPADPRADWRVGFTELRGVGLAPENVYLGSAIPRLLRERLTPIRRHTLSLAERRGQARQVLAAARRAGYADLAALLRRRDSQALSGGDGDDLAAQVAERRARLDQLQALSWEDVEIAERKPVVIVAGVEDRGLLPAPRYSPLQAAQEADLDLLVTGRLEQVEGILFVELQAISPALGGSAQRYADALRRDGLADAVAALQQHLGRLLVGEPWGTITVVPTPPDSAVYVDGEFAGNGRVELPYRTLGRYTVRVTAPGHEPVQRPLGLAGAGMVLAVTLPPLPARRIAVATTPAGAALYVDSLWIGTTPLQIAAPERPARLLLRRDGYHDAALVVRAGAPGPIHVELEAAGYDLAVRQEEMRNRFYDHLGTALLSLAAPLALFSAAGNAAQDVGAGGERHLLYGGGIAATAVTGALVARAVVALGDYLDAASRGAR